MKCASTSTIIQVNMQNTTSTFNLDHIGIKGTCCILHVYLNDNTCTCALHTSTIYDNVK